MQITYLRDDSPSSRTCPTLFATDRGTFIVQGKKVDDAAVLISFGLRNGEAVVEVPARLLEEIAADSLFPPQDGGSGVGLALVRAVPRDTSSSSVSATSRRSFIVRGAEVTHAEALAVMDIPDHETAVEVPRELLCEISTDAA